MNLILKTVIKVTALTCFGSAILIALMPHCRNMYFMYIVCGLYGLLTASMVLTPSSIILLVGYKKFGPALGIIMFIYGSMVLSGIGDAFHHIFPEAKMTSNKNAHYVRHHFQEKFFVLFHMVRSILFEVLA